MFSWYEYLNVNLVFFSISVFGAGMFFLIAPFPELCLLVPFYNGENPVNILVLTFLVGASSFTDNNNSHYISDEFEFRPDRIMDCEDSCPLAF